MQDDLNDPFNWSSIIYHVAAPVPQAKVTQLVGALKRHYGAQARVHVQYYLDARQRKVLFFSCGEVKNAAQAKVLQRLVAQLMPSVGVRYRLFNL